MKMKNLQDKLNEGRQYRNASKIEIRKSEEGNEDEKVVEGYASTFNEEYLLGTYMDWYGNDVYVYEQIDPSAFEECDMSDVVMQYDHEGRVMARTRNNTLEVSTDEHGLFIRADLSKSSLGEGLYTDIKNGIIDRMSFGFTVQEDERVETEDHENHSIKVLRTITKVGKLYDVSAVTFPANEGTEISARAYSDGVLEELKAERLKAQMEVQKRKKLELKLKMLEGE